MDFRGKFRLKLNVIYELRDKDGNLKPLFNENRLGQFLLQFFRKIVKNPITPDGKIKPGLLNYLATFGLQIPYITGNFAYSRKVSNLVTDAGKAAVAGLINGVITNFFEYIALGTGTTAAAAGDTALQTETTATGLARASSTTSRVTTDVTNDTARLTNAFTNTSGGNVAVTESGVLDSAAAGTLLARQVFSAVNVGNNDSFTPTWNFDVD